ncbi:MAG: hypothetical protein Q9M33_12715 [Robiginitomaculum sp.]|nr:hypothetical protein [Robiginitomaculum sp.]MDQ7076770.1 hypothetical protein [Robiginitomaculum sp.]
MRIFLRISVRSTLMAVVLLWPIGAMPVAAQQNSASRTVQLSPAQLENLRQIEVAKAAKLYTEIAFSTQNQRKMRGGLPLSDTDFDAAIKDIKPRFQACLEGGFEARLGNAFEAQVLRKTIQSTQSANVAEPKKAKTIIPAFKATSDFCAGRIKVWLASAIK